MKIPFRPPKKKMLKATTARRPREADFTEEPNVRLSSAFVVVLILHVVAVGGIYAFNAIKAHQPSGYEDTETTAAASPAPAQAVASTNTADATDATDVAAAPSATPAAPVYYRVKSGDTVVRIATAYGVSAGDIVDLNDLRDTGGIHVGEQLKLPPGAALPQSEPVKTVAALRDSGITYTVVHGDTPVSIARKLHVLYDDLIRLNNIADPRKLKIGLKLKVPMKRPTV
jgi:LysM repeat protein